MLKRLATLLIVSAVVCPLRTAQQGSGAAPATRPTPEWIKRSNDHAQVLLNVNARFFPEGAAASGVAGLDDQIIDLKPRFQERRREALREVLTELQKRLAEEKDYAVRQDLEIMIKRAQQDIRGTELQQKYMLPYYNMSELVFGGIRALLDDQVPQERRLKALVRLRKYAGLEPGYDPLTKLVEDWTRGRLNVSGLIGPFRDRMEKDFANSVTYSEGIAKLFDKYKIAGYEPALTKLKEQLAEYDAFLRKEVLPRARADFRLPPEMYAYVLEITGVEMPPDQLAAIARASFDEIQNEMMALAPEVAKQKGILATDYRNVIRALKRDQWEGQSILPNYEKRIAEVEDIIRREHLVTLPNRPLKIRLASEAESAATPAPNMRPPRMIGNTGESGVFILPLRIPAPPGAKPGATQQFDDFTFAAASWTLTAHEGRPGHEVQFDSIVEKGVSLARALFAGNSVNVEGWGLYAEAILKPYMPLDGQLICLQHRLVRAARAFLDPELQAGRIKPEEAKKLLMEDVVLSEAMANQEVERYMFWSPGQAPSYFYGYTQLMRLRADAEKAMGPRFEQQKFHDFILSQGTLPPPLLRKAAFDTFVPQNTTPRQAE